MQLTVLLFVSIIVSFLGIQSSIDIYSQGEDKDNTDNYEDLFTKLKEIIKNRQTTNQLFEDEEDKTPNTIIPFQLKSGNKIAFVMPTFTVAAYNYDTYNSFYTFFKKYASVTNENEFVTTDLDLLTVNVPSLTEALLKYKYNGLENLANRISSLSQNIETTFLTDTDVHNGLVFDNNNNKNIYDILILGHQEYVTQEEYNNFKKFVENGGILILLNSNIFYAEVAYNPINEKITLVKGHHWAFDGEKAWPSVFERWQTENSEWVGSNFFDCGKGCYIDFKNNPFSYSKHEEQYITNPNVNILIDFQAQIAYEAHYQPQLQNIRIAAYELEYGKGKVISFGLFGDDIIHNKEFLRFFDKVFFSNLSSV